VLQPKWDGFRLLVEVAHGGRVRAWSRHGTSLTSRLAGLVAAFDELPCGSVFDGELVVVGELDGRSVQDFASVGRAVFGGSTAAISRLQFVAFDLLRWAGEDLRVCPWRERDQLLGEVLPGCAMIRRIQSLPASAAAHAAVVELGFEGTVLKRPGSTYRPGRHATWVKHKARHTAQGVLTSVGQDRDGQWHGVCEVDGRRQHAVAGPASSALLGTAVTLVYSRVDADGDLREARIAAAHAGTAGRADQIASVSCSP
jgi:ATP-dependent DNA ligase